MRIGCIQVLYIISSNNEYLGLEEEIAQVPKLTRSSLCTEIRGRSHRRTYSLTLG